MKRTLVLTILATSLITGCSTFKSAGQDPSVKETRLATDFKREGIKVTYTWSGDVEKIEAYGYAPVWRGEYRIAAEADAKDKLVKFLRGETVDTQRMTRVIAKSLEKSQDNTLKSKTPDGAVHTTDIEVDNDTKELATEGNDNSSLRRAAISNARIVTSTITVAAQGRLNGVYKERGYTQDDGKYYVAVYAWTPKMQESARFITTAMDKK